MSKSISKNHSRRAMEYIEETSEGDLEYGQILSLYEKFRKDKNTRHEVFSRENTRQEALYKSVLSLLGEKIKNGLHEERGDPGVVIFEYSQFPYRLEVFKEYQEEVGGYPYSLLYTNSEGEEYAIEENYEEEYKDAIEDGVVALVDNIVSYAIRQTK